MIPNWKQTSRVQSPLTSSRFDEPTDKNHTVTIEMKEMDHDGRYINQSRYCESKLKERPPLKMSRLFLKRLGLLKKHKTFTDISSNLINETYDQSDFQEHSEYKTDSFKTAYIDSDTNIEGSTVNLTVFVDVEKQLSKFTKDETINLNNSDVYKELQ